MASLKAVARMSEYEGYEPGRALGLYGESGGTARR